MEKEDFEVRLSKLKEANFLDLIPRKIKDKMVEKIHEVRILCKQNGLGEEVTESIITAFIFNIEATIGYELAIAEENIE
jgi:hypothetical protein